MTGLLLALVLVAQPPDYDFLGVNKKLDALGEKVALVDTRTDRIERKLDELLARKGVEPKADLPALPTTSPQAATKASSVTYAPPPVNYTTTPVNYTTTPVNYTYQAPGYTYQAPSYTYQAPSYTTTPAWTTDTRSYLTYPATAGAVYDTAPAPRRGLLGLLRGARGGGCSGGACLLNP